MHVQNHRLQRQVVWIVENLLSQKPPISLILQEIMFLEVDFVDIQ